MLRSDDLHERPWRLTSGTGTLLAPRLRFLKDGRTWGHPSPLEARWALADDVLSLLAADGTETARFCECATDATGEPSLNGLFLRPPEAGLTYQLRPARPRASSQQTGTLHSAVTLGGPSKILFVSFGSLKRGFIDHQARWEFYHLPIGLGLDHVRITESWSPDLMWYVDKTSRIRALLGALLAGGYRRVIMCGISSGGYASLLFSELLCQDYPLIDFCSFTINPQTAHNAAIRAYLRSLHADYVPALISDHALSFSDTPHTDIAAVAKASKFRGNVAHHLFYDSGNPAEQFYVSQLDGLSGVHRHCHHLAVGHLSGCIELYKCEVLHDAVRDAVLECGP